MNRFTKLLKSIKGKLSGRGRQQEQRPPDPLDQHALQDNLVDPLAVAQQVGGMAGGVGAVGGELQPGTPWVAPQMNRPGGRSPMGGHRAKPRGLPQVEPEIIEQVQQGDGDQLVGEELLNHPGDDTQTDNPYLVNTHDEVKSPYLVESNDHESDEVEGDNPYLVNTNDEVKSPYLVESDDHESDEVEGDNPYLVNTNDEVKSPYLVESDDQEKVEGDNPYLINNHEEEQPKSPYLVESKKDAQVTAPTQSNEDTQVEGDNPYLINNHEDEQVKSDNPYLINNHEEEQAKSPYLVESKKDAPVEQVTAPTQSNDDTQVEGDNPYLINNHEEEQVKSDNPYLLNNHEEEQPKSPYLVESKKDAQVTAPTQSNEDTQGDNPYLLNNHEEEQVKSDNPYLLNNHEEVQPKSPYLVESKKDAPVGQVTAPTQSNEDTKVEAKSPYLLDNHEEETVEGKSRYLVENHEEETEGDKTQGGETEQQPTVIQKDPMAEYKGKGRVQQDGKWTQKSKSNEMNHWDKVGKLLSEGKVDEANKLKAPTGKQHYEAPTVKRDRKPQKNWATTEHKVGGPLMQSLDEHYRGEETGSSLADKDGGLATEIGGKKMTGTYYAKDDKEFGTQIQDGRLTQNGEVVNSTNNFSNKGKELTPGNKAIYVQKDKHERVNFAMDGKGGLFTGDVRTETDRRMDHNEGTGQRHNHSSLVGGKDVSAAGTLKVREGKVEEIGDNSGHYKPSLSHMQQAISHLQGKGVMDEQRSSVRLGKKGPNRDLVISGTEMSGWKGEIDKSRETFEKTGDRKALAEPEQKIRAMHQKKSSLQEDLLRTDQAIPDFNPNAKVQLFGQQRNPARIDRFQNDGVVEESTIQPSKVKAVSQHEQKKKAESERLRIASQERRAKEQREKEERQRLLRLKKEQQNNN